MALFKSNVASAAIKAPIPTAERAIEVIPAYALYTVTGSEADTDVIEMIPLPPGYVVFDGWIDNEDCGTTLTLDCGIMSGAWGDPAVRTCGAEFLNNHAAGTAGRTNFNVQGFSAVAPSDTTRSIGFKVDAAVSALTAGAKIRLGVLMRPQIEGA